MKGGLIISFDSLTTFAPTIRLSHIGRGDLVELEIVKMSPMNVTNLFTSSLGKKFIMAVTGMALFLFVVLHLLGNLQIFLGPEAINRYGNLLQTNTEILWPARIILLILILLHIWSAIKLSAENRAARPKPYAHYER